MVFLVLRQRSSTIQAILTAEQTNVSKQMVRFAETIHPESIILVQGIFKRPVDIVKSCSIADLEIKINKVGFLAGG